MEQKRDGKDLVVQGAVGDDESQQNEQSSYLFQRSFSDLVLGKIVDVMHAERRVALELHHELFSDLLCLSGRVRADDASKNGGSNRVEDK